MIFKIFLLFFILYTSNHMAFVDALFPKMNGRLLAKKDVYLPDYFKHKVTCVLMGYSRDVQTQFDLWVEPFEERYSEREDMMLFQIPMIGKQAKWFSRFIDSGMRKGFDERFHPFVMTYYGDLNYYLNYFQVEDQSLAYVYLLDVNGVIRFSFVGKPTSQDLEQLFYRVETLLEEGQILKFR